MKSQEWELHKGFVSHQSHFPHGVRTATTGDLQRDARIDDSSSGTTFGATSSTDDFPLETWSTKHVQDLIRLVGQ